jgi:hypothetical protein
MYQKNEKVISNLKSNIEFIDSRIIEINEFIENMQTQNQPISPVTNSILELNKSMKERLENTIERYSVK